MNIKDIFNSSKSLEFSNDKIYLNLLSRNNINFIVELFQCYDVKTYFTLSDAFQEDLNLFVEFSISKFEATGGFDFIVYNLQKNPVGLINCTFANFNGNPIANVAYAIHDNHRNKGYANEALKLICSITDQSQLYALRLDINIDNIFSEKIAEKNGFKKIGPLFDFKRPDTGIRFEWIRECNKGLPKRVELSLNAIRHFQANDYYKAIELLREALKYENPMGSPHTDIQIYSNLGMALSTTKQYKEAYNFLMKAFHEGLRNEETLKEIEWLKTNASQYIY